MLMHELVNCLQTFLSQHEEKKNNKEVIMKITSTCVETTNPNPGNILISSKIASFVQQDKQLAMC